MNRQHETNTLIHETSPYLLQHARNPVYWRPWGAEALQLARAEDKPILLSIGYSACHWCHVMAHESFEDATTAAVMNELFINIKVDREERPDLDRIYQLAHQLLARRPGGWPLTLFLHPESHVPFFAGTYFPPEDRYGIPGFREVLRRVAAWYREQPAAVREHNQSLLETFQRLDAAPPAVTGAELDATLLEQGIAGLQRNFDPEHGGFGQAPKFPVPTSLALLLKARGANPLARDMALFTLRKMARGGIHDLIGGGFCRYSADAHWGIPHFEKMLYDNGQLLDLYAQAWRLSRDDFCLQICRQTADWTMREMQSPAGGFYSSLDADSEGEEGRFYLWTPEQAMKLLNPEEYLVFSRHCGLDLPPNFEGEWHLFNHRDAGELATLLRLPVDHVNQLLGSAREKLYTARRYRIWPGRDEKILTAWNALAIRGLVSAGLACAEPRYIDAASRALDFIRGTLWRDGRLLATCKDDHAHLNAYLDDYAFLLDAVLHLLEAAWSLDLLDFARRLADCLLEYFLDRERGGFYFTAHDHEKLLRRDREFTDDALPSGNAIAASALTRLGHLIGQGDYLAAARGCLKAAQHGIEQYPSAHCGMLLVLQDYCEPPRQIILRGPMERLADWQRRCHASVDPHTTIYAIPSHVSGLPETLAQYHPLAEMTAYICEGNRCLTPIQGEAALGDYLKNQAGLA